VKKPVHSNTTSTPNSPHGNSAGFGLAKALISLPFTTMLPSAADASPSKRP